MFISDVPLQCINAAAQEYHIPAKLIVSVLNVEQGHVGSASHNKNNSYDFGPMQINSSWLPVLSYYGISKNDVRYNPCVNVRVGAWILASAIADGRNLLSGVGDYNSHTTTWNTRYAQLVREKYTLVNGFLVEKSS